MAKPVVGLQMYSLRDQTEIDFIHTLEKVAEIGYKAIEFTGYFKMPLKEIKSKLDELNLIAPSAHVPLNFSDTKHFESDFAGQLEYAKELGLTYIVTPWAPLPEQPTMDDVKYLADLLTRCGQQVKDAGMQLAYHNHEFIFKIVDKKSAIDHIMSIVPEHLLQMEFDLGWLYLSGNNPSEYLHKYKGRVPLVHLRDFSVGRKDAEIGKGEVGYDQLLNELEPAGVSYMFVEQEQFESSSLESAANNYKYLKEQGYM